jgi:hypothetical protein
MAWSVIIEHGPSRLHPMLRSLAILAISLSACNAGLAQSNDDEIRLRATVQAIVPLTSFSGTITPVAGDPKFALTVRIESAVPAVDSLAEGAVVAFAIHSPSLLFAGEPTKGKTYDFSLLRKIENGKGSFVGLRVVKPQSPVTFCDLVRNPEKYNGEEITVRATYRYGVEWSQLYCLDCADKGKAWLQIPVDLDDASQRSLRKLPKGAGIVNLTVQGVFSSGGSFGHENGHRFQIVANRISDVAVIQKGAKPPAVEEKHEKQRACGGSNSK